MTDPDDKPNVGWQPWLWAALLIAAALFWGAVGWAIYQHWGS